MPPHRIPSISLAEIDQPDLTLFGRFDQDRAGAIAKDDAGRAVGIVDDRRHGVRPNHQNLGVDPGLDQFRSHLEARKENRSKLRKDRSPTQPWAPSLSCTRQAVAGKSMSGVTVATITTSTSFGLDPPIGQAAARCFDRHITGRHAGFHQVALANAERCMIHSSEVFTHFCQIGIIEDARRHIGCPGR